MSETYTIRIQTKKGGKIDPGATYTAQEVAHKFLKELNRSPTIRRETTGISITGNYTLEEIQKMREKIAKGLSSLVVTLEEQQEKKNEKTTIRTLHKENQQLTRALETAKNDYATLEGLLDSEITIPKDASREEKFAAIFKAEEGPRFQEIAQLYGPAAAKAQELGIPLETAPELIESAKEEFKDTPQYHQLHARKREIEKGISYLRRHSPALMHVADTELKSVIGEIESLRITYEKKREKSLQLKDLIAPLEGKQVNILYDFTSQKIILPFCHEKKDPLGIALESYIEDRLKQTKTAFKKNTNGNGAGCVMYSLAEKPLLDSLFLEPSSFSKLGIILGIDFLGSRTYAPQKDTPLETRVDEEHPEPERTRHTRTRGAQEPVSSTTPQKIYDMTRVDDIIQKADESQYTLVREIIKGLDKSGKTTQESRVQHAQLLYAISDLPGTEVRIADIKEKIEQYQDRKITGKELMQYRNRIVLLKNLGVLRQGKRGEYIKNPEHFQQEKA